MAVINMHDAKSQLSDLVARAEAGEEIVIARRNKPAVRLVAVHADRNAQIRKSREEAYGSMAHLRDAMKDVDWFEPLPEDELQAWDGEASRGFGESEQASYNLIGLPEAVEAGKEFTIMRDGKPFATVLPVVTKKPRVPGRFAHLRGAMPSDLFNQPPDEDELDAWDGKYSGEVGP